MTRNIQLYLQDISESILAIEEYTQQLDEVKFNSNRQVQDAVIRRLEIIGEAVKNIDKHFKDKYPIIEWKEIGGMRDVIAHEYFGVRLDRIWDAIKKDLPYLKEKIRHIIEQENSAK